MAAILFNLDTAFVPYMGTKSISGTVYRSGIAGGPYLVRLYDRALGRYIKSTWSSTNGAYSFSYLAPESMRYLVVAFDNQASPLNAGVADLVTPE